MQISIGHGNYVEIDRMVTILNPYSSPARRLRLGADELGMLINAAGGRTARSLIVLTTGHIVLSALTIRTLKSRFGQFLPEDCSNCPLRLSS